MFFGDLFANIFKGVLKTFGIDLDPAPKEIDEAIQNKIKQLQEKLIYLEEHADNTTDFQKAQQQLDDAFVDFVGELKMTEVIKKTDQRKHICFIGPTSSGKSTVINELYGLKQKVGLGSTTSQARPVYNGKKVVVWDAPGINKDWGTYNANNLCFFHDLDFVFLLYSAEPQENRLLIRILEKLNRNMAFVRTKCDNWHPGEIKSVKQWIQDDRQKFDKLCSKKYDVLPTGKEQRTELKNYLIEFGFE